MSNYECWKRQLCCSLQRRHHSTVRTQNFGHYMGVLCDSTRDHKHIPKQGYDQNLLSIEHWTKQQCSSISRVSAVSWRLESTQQWQEQVLMTALIYLCLQSSWWSRLVVRMTRILLSRRQITAGNNLWSNSPKTHKTAEGWGSFTKYHAVLHIDATQLGSVLHYNLADCPCPPSHQDTCMLSLSLRILQRQQDFAQITEGTGQALKW